jgi:HD superfamily phosphohydrolase
MHFYDILKDSKCNKIFNEVNEFVDLNLHEYNRSLKEKQLKYSGKDIFDSIWGTVSFSHVEELLIDSPLLQRLKRIKQLGYAYQVYCNADYNRFSHTVGVTETAKRIAEMIEKRILPNREDRIKIISIVRLAAIMHDTGHMFFSHVSEKFLLYNENFRRNKEVKNALNHFNEKISDRAALHEMISVMIVNSDSFLEFLQIVFFDRYLDEHDQRKIIDYISGLIVGVAVDKKILPYSKIIKGAIDADRMDYLSRDSYITKVPLAVDMARLISKISVIKTQKFTPSSVWNDDAVGPFNEMAIQYSAQTLVWQMSMARTILYQNIYFHHKKLTAEAILDRALENIFLLFSDEQMTFSHILSLTDDVFSEHFYKILDLQDQQEKAVFIEACTLIKSLKNRSFYKRVAGFSTDNVHAPSITSYELFKTHVIENPFSAKFIKFTKDISDEYRKILNILNKNLPENDPKFMFIQAGWNSEAEIGLPIDTGDGEYVMSTDLYKETPFIGEENKQKHYYLLTDSEERDIVYLALEKVLFTERKFTLRSATYSCAKFTAEQLNQRRISLFERGYYDGALELLSNPIIHKLIDADLFKTVTTKYRSFVGANNTCITQDSLMNFLRQFLRTKCNSDQIKLYLMVFYAL